MLRKGSLRLRLALPTVDFRHLTAIKQRNGKTPSYIMRILGHKNGLGTTFSKHTRIMNISL